MVVLTIITLFAEFASLVEATIEAVFCNDALLSVFVLTCTTSVNAAFVPDAKVGLVQDTVPLAPTTGVVQVQPLVIGVSDWKVVPGGSGSVSVVLVASIGPALLAVSVYVRLLPALTGLGAAAFVR